MKLNKINFIITVFLIVYFVLLLLNQLKGMIVDEGVHTMDSFFFYNLLKDVISNPSIVLNLKNYVLKFYAHYPALYIVYYPPFFAVLTAILYIFLGVSLFTARLTSIIFSILSLITTYFLGKKLYNEKVGLLSIFVLAFSPYFFIFSNIVYIDVPLLFFILLSILLFYKGVEENKKYFYYFGFVFGLGFLMKQEIIILIFPFFIYLLYRKKFIENWKILFKSIILFSVISFLFFIPLFIYSGSKMTDLISYFIVKYPKIFCYVCPSVDFFTNFYFYPLMLFYESFILVFLIPIIYLIWKRKLKKEDIFLWLIITIYFVFFTIIPNKVSKYILPTIPLFCIFFINIILKQKKYFIFIFLVVIVSQIIIDLFFPPYYTFVPLETDKNQLNRDLRPIGEYLSENIVKNGNIFLMPNFDNPGVIFNFAKSNNFENYVFRWRDCTFENMTKEQFADYVNKNNIYFVVMRNESDKNFVQLKEWVNKNFIPDVVLDDIIIYKNSKKNFNPIKEVCDYNCKLQTEFCYNISSLL